MFFGKRMYYGTLGLMVLVWFSVVGMSEVEEPSSEVEENASFEEEMEDEIESAKDPLVQEEVHDELKSAKGFFSYREVYERNIVLRELVDILIANMRKEEVPKVIQEDSSSAVQKAYNALKRERSALSYTRAYASNLFLKDGIVDIFMGCICFLPWLIAFFTPQATNVDNNDVAINNGGINLFSKDKIDEKLGNLSFWHEIFSFLSLLLPLMRGVVHALGRPDAHQKMALVYRKRIFRNKCIGEALVALVVGGLSVSWVLMGGPQESTNAKFLGPLLYFFVSGFVRWIIYAGTSLSREPAVSVG